MIENASVIELPVKILNDTKKKLKIPLTVSTLELPPRNEFTSNPHLNSEEVTLDKSQPSGNLSPGIADLANDVSFDDPGTLSFDEVHDAVSFLSLPEDEQNSIITGPDWFTDSQVGSQIPPADDVPPRVFSTEISETRICKICFVYETHCSCPKKCSTCSALVQPSAIVIK